MERTRITIGAPALALALALAALTDAGVARADGELYAGGSAGGAVSFTPLVNGAFVLREEFGWHPSGNAEGFTLGLVVGEQFGGAWAVTFHPRIGYDVPIVTSSGFAFQIGPWGMVPGVGIAQSFQGGETIVYYDMIFGVDLRFLFLDRGLTVFARAASIDVGIGGPGPTVSVGYEGAVGVFANFP